MFKWRLLGISRNMGSNSSVRGWSLECGNSREESIEYYGDEVSEKYM